MEPNEVWDNVVDTTKKVGRTVAAVAVDIYDQGKKKVEIARIKGELRTNYEKLGRVAYAEAKGVKSTAERKEIVEKIDNLKKELAKARETVESDSVKKHCPKCSRPLDSDATFCSGCGQKL